MEPQLYHNNIDTLFNLYWMLEIIFCCISWLILCCINGWWWTSIKLDWHGVTRRLSAPDSFLLSDWSAVGYTGLWLARADSSSHDSLLSLKLCLSYNRWKRKRELGEQIVKLKTFTFEILRDSLGSALSGIIYWISKYKSFHENIFELYK